MPDVGIEALAGGAAELLPGLFGGAAELGGEALGAGAGEALGGALGGAEGALGGGAEAAFGGLGGEALGAGAAGGAELGGAAAAAENPLSAFASAFGETGGNTAGVGAFDAAGGLGNGVQTAEALGVADNAALGGATGGATGAEGAGQGGSVFDKLIGAVGKQNPITTLGQGISGGALAYNLINGQKTPANEKVLQGTAGALNAQGQQLASYLQSGTLPTGLQEQVKQANAAAKARVIANHAHNGMGTDPSQNSALAQELNSIDQQSAIQIAQIGQQLLTTGIQETGLANQLYMQLIGLDQKQSALTGQAIANFAAALSGGYKPQQQQQIKYS